jgi:crossover junction endodeoxyribonuclease RusA
MPIETIRLTLPLPPSVNRLWRTGRGRLYRSAEYAAWRNEAIWSIKLQARGASIAGPYSIAVEFQRPDRRRRDLDNLLKALSDALVDAGVLEDDSDAQEIRLCWRGTGRSCEVILAPAS